MATKITRRITTWAWPTRKWICSKKPWKSFRSRLGCALPTTERPSICNAATCSDIALCRKAYLNWLLNGSFKGWVLRILLMTNGRRLRFDLAAAYERAGDLDRAKDLFTEIYGVNVSYRGVNERLKALETRMA